MFNLNIREIEVRLHHRKSPEARNERGCRYLKSLLRLLLNMNPEARGRFPDTSCIPFTLQQALLKSSYHTYFIILFYFPRSTYNRFQSGLCQNHSFSFRFTFIFDSKTKPFLCKHAHHFHDMSPVTIQNNKNYNS